MNICTGPFEGKFSLKYSRYKCGRGRAFLDPATLEHYNTSKVVCGWDQTYNHSQFDPCVWTHCINPPDPDAQHKLKLIWNPLAPPAHNDSILYICDAGSTYNRFETDFNQWNYSLTCMENNQFSEPSWPTCVDSKLKYKSYLMRV